MRKTSQDGGDTTSITSGVETETKKTGAIIKTKRNSIKRKVQSLSHESDDAVIEPLLQKDKDKADMSSQSAKYNILSKTKTDVSSERETDKETLLQDDKKQLPSSGESRNVTDTMITIPSSIMLPKSTGAAAPLHNHMNTNVFSSHDALKGLITTKSQILVEIDASKQSGYSPSPVIFTTAKIHTDGKTKQMEPLQVTPVPILSTIEVSVLKGTGINKSSETTGVITSNINTMNPNVKSKISISDKDAKVKSSSPVIMPTSSSNMIDSKALNDKTSFSYGVAYKDKKVSDSESGTTKDSKLLDLQIVSMNVQDAPSCPSTENKSKKIDDKVSNVGKPKKNSLSQPISGVSSDKKFTTASSEINKSISIPIGSKVISDNNTIKDARLIAGQVSSNDRADILRNKEWKPDFNKEITARTTARSDTSDTKSDVISKDKLLMGPSSGSKQLQRQKISLDKDDSTKIKSSYPTISNQSPMIKPEEVATSIPKHESQTKSSENNVRSLGDKTKLPKSTANNVQITSPTTANAKSPIITTATVNKSTTSNSITSVKPITFHNPASSISKTSSTKVTDAGIYSTTQPSLTTKSLTSNVVTDGSFIKPTRSVTSSKPQVTSTTQSKPTVPVAINTKTTTASTTVTPTISSQPISNANLPTSRPSPKSIVTETPVAAVSTGKSYSTPASTTKAPYVSTSTVKTPSGLTSTVKTPSVSISTAKSPAVSTSTGKTQSESISISKTPSMSTSITKAPTVSTCTAKSPSVSTCTAKSPSVSTSTAKTPSEPASTTKTLVSTSIAKSQDVSTDSAKTSSVPTSTKLPLMSTSSVISPPKSNTTSISKTTVVTSAASNATTVTTSTHAGTSKLIQPNKKGEAKPTELSNGSKSMKA